MVCLFRLCRLLFGFMVKARDSWLSSQPSSQQLPNSNCMSTLLETRQQECLPSLTNHSSCKFSVPVALPGSTGPRLQNLKTEQINEARGPLRCLPPDFHALLPTPTSYINGKQSTFPYGLSGMVVPDANFPGLCQKGFLIFNQSENQTRLFYNYVRPPTQSPSIANERLDSGYDDLQMVDNAAKMDRVDSTKNVSCEASGGKTESEMHEDTEEINALLYSDDDGNDSHDGYVEDDEVTSTGRFPPMHMKDGYEKQEHIGEITEDVASSDGPNKRQKMFDGGYNKSSLLYTASLVNLDGSHEDDNNPESGYADGQTGVEGSGCTLGNMRSKKDKILEILRVLESIIPGVKGKDPLLVIDGAIDYLMITKLKAETLGVSFL